VQVGGISAAPHAQGDEQTVDEKRCRAGFTLVELLIVIAIIAVLASVAIRPLLRAKSAAKESAAIQVIRSLQKAETAYFLRHKRYGNLDDLAGFGGSPVSEGQREAASEYVFKSVADQKGYTIIATPPQANMRTYTLSESGVIEGE
jgi:prepilin-type N-terminal cleavage/methylation domain-containing protein